MLAACAPQYSDNLRIRIKRNTFSNAGYAAAVYNDRIYFVSNELGPEGVYSMKLDGSDVRMEAENPSITGLELFDQRLYYIGLYKIADRQGSVQSSTVNNHTLCYCVPESDSHMSSFISPNYNITGFYISQNGYTASVYGAAMGDLHLFDKYHNETFSTAENIIATISFQYGENSEDSGDETSSESEIKESVYQFGDFLIMAGYDPVQNDMNWIAGDSFVFDNMTGEMVLTFSNIPSGFKAFYMDKSDIYCSYNEMIVIIDRTTFQTKETFMPDGLSHGYEISDMVPFGNKLYVVADRWAFPDERRGFLGEELFTLDMDTLVCSKLLSLDSKQRILGLNENNIILLDNGVIYTVAMDETGLGEKTKIIDAPADICEKNYTIDYAGDWMFIYKIYPENGAFTYGSGSIGQHLLYRINLQNGEVAKNDTPLDFSVLDRYKETN